LRECNDGLVSLIVRVNTSEVSASVQSRSRMSTEELFTQFYRSLYGDDPQDDLKTAFLELTEEGE
jgi:hypothetical protein